MLDEQKSMRATYINGGPGVIVSGTIWVLSALLTYFISFEIGMIALFVGGVLIHPISGLIERLLKADNLPPTDSKLARLAVITLPLIFGGLYLGYVLSADRQALFFVVMAIAIGLRYLVFERIYGLKAFWTLGGTLVGIGVCAYFATAFAPFQIALAVGLTELVFGFWLTRKPI